MNSTDISRHTISSKATILEALDRLNLLSGRAPMTLVVIDEVAGGKVCGTITDGDVRRSFLAGKSPDEAVTTIARSDFRAIRPGDDVVDKIRSIRATGVRLLPVLAEDGSIERLIDLRVTHNLLPLSALVMAGGKGERLRPLTDATPKPLLPIGDKPIIDYAVEALARAGVEDVTVSVRYLAEQIEEHFSRPVADLSVRCVRESLPLGTIGALAVVAEDMKHEDVLVTNSDLLSDISYENMYLAHRADGNDITIAAIPYTLSVPYAILSTDPSSRRVNALEEKPVYSYYANAGIYIIGHRAVALLRAGEPLDATDLIDRAINSGLRVGYYPLNGTWIDIGTPADYRHACEIMNKQSIRQ